MTRIKAIIAAGTLTGIVLVTAIAFGVKNLSANTRTQSNSTANPTTESGQSQVDLLTMLEREAQYRQQLEAANQTIQELQAQQSQRSDDDHEEHEEHDDD